MIQNIYNFRDERVGEYGTPIFTNLNEEQIAASYEKSVKEAQAKIARLTEVNPNSAELGQLVLQVANMKDCVIYLVGTFDPVSGHIEMVDQKLVCRLSDFFIGGFHVN